MALLWLTGFEHGVAPTTSGGGLFNTVTGTVAINATAKRSGSYGLQVHPLTAVSSYVAKTVAVSTVVARFYVCAHAAPGAEIFLLDLVNTVGQLGISLTTGLVVKSWIGATSKVGPTLSLDTWYRIEVKAYTGTTTHTIDFQVAEGDGAATAYDQNSVSGLSSVSITSVRLGAKNGATADMYFDDLIVSDSGTDYPFGAGSVIGLSPSADGTHNNPSDYMQDNAGLHIGDVTAYDKLADVPLSTNTSYVKQTGNSTASYAEVQFADTTKGSINGVMAVLAYMSAATQANEGGCIIRDSNGQETTVWGNPTTRADMSENSMFYKSAVVSTPSGGWTKDHVNALRARLGYSNDTNPVPYWENLILEVDGPVGENYSGTAAISFSGSVSSAAKKGAKAAPSIPISFSLAAVGKKSGKGTASVSLTGSVAAVEKKGAKGAPAIAFTGTIEAEGGQIETHSGTAAVSFIGSIAAEGKKGGKGAASVAVTGSVASGVKKGAQGEGAVPFTGALAAAGKKAGKGGVTLPFTGAMTAEGGGEGQEAYSGTAAVSFAGTVAAAGRKGAKGAASVSLAADVSAAGTKAGKGAVALSWLGAVLGAGRKGAKADPAIAASLVMTVAGTPVRFDPSDLPFLSDEHVAIAKGQGDRIPLLGPGLTDDHIATAGGQDDRIPALEPTGSWGR